ncbi:MAG: hypothetical protein ACREL5_00995 [Gemmatimonadales bacterium]
MQYLLSPAGQHIAAVVMHGSRKVVVHDGVDGPPLDEVWPFGQGTVLWSDDGSRLAYMGRQGQEYVLVVDDKEYARGPWSDPTPVHQPTVSQAGFSLGSKHFWYVRAEPTSSSSRATQMVVDGKAGPVSSGDVQAVWSGDGEHYAYLQTIQSHSGPDRQVLILDGQPAPYLAGAPQFTADGHLFTQRPAPANSGVDVLADGHPFLRALEVHLYPSPMGPGVVGVVWSNAAGGKRIAQLTVGNRAVAGSQESDGYDVIVPPTYSPVERREYQGKRRGHLVVDGERRRAHLRGPAG